MEVKINREIRVSYAEEARVSFHQHLLGADEAGYGKEAEGGFEIK